jgi:hypothetical protein
MNLFTEEKRWPVGPMRPTFSGFGLVTGLNQANMTFLPTYSEIRDKWTPTHLKDRNFVMEN